MPGKLTEITIRGGESTRDRPSGERLSRQNHDDRKGVTNDSNSRKDGPTKVSRECVGQETPMKRKKTPPIQDTTGKFQMMRKQKVLINLLLNQKLKTRD